MHATPSYLPAGSLITTTGGQLVGRTKQDVRRNDAVPPIDSFEWFIPILRPDGRVNPIGTDGHFWVQPGFTLHVAGFGWWPRPDEDHH